MRAAGKRERIEPGLLPFLLHGRGRPIVRVGILAVCLLGAGWVMRAAKAEAWRMPAFRVVPTSVRIEGLPSWLDDEARALFAPRSMARFGGRYAYSIYDPHVEGWLTEHIERHPLIARVQSLRVGYPAEVVARVAMREPVALVPVTSLDGQATTYLLGADRTLLPMAPYRGLLARRRRPLPHLIGIGVQPPTRRVVGGTQRVFGQVWDDGSDDRVEEGVAAAQLAGHLEHDLRGRIYVQRIDVSRFTRTGIARKDDRRAEVELEIVCAPATPGEALQPRRLLWGRTSRAAHEVVGEDGYARKLERLRGLLALPRPPDVLEVRWDV